MVVCAAYGCRSGYNSQKSATDDADETHPKLSYHSFPIQDKDLFEKWVRAIRRQNFVATKYSKLCSLHLKETDFVEVSIETPKNRGGNLVINNFANDIWRMGLSLRSFQTPLITWRTRVGFRGRLLGPHRDWTMRQWRRRRIVPSASPRAALGDEVSATSFSWPRHMRAGGQFSPSPSYLPTDRVQSVYSS